jgi:cytochrome c2
MPKKVNPLLILIMIATLVLTACGGGGGNDDDKAKAGEELFKQTIIDTQAGCATCHSVEAGVVIVGPSMAGIAGRAGSTVSGMSAEEYLRQSILEPDSHLVEGFPSGTMPQVWSDVHSTDQVDQLVAYLMTLK